MSLLTCPLPVTTFSIPLHPPALIQHSRVQNHWINFLWLLALQSSLQSPQQRQCPTFPAPLSLYPYATDDPNQLITSLSPGRSHVFQLQRLILGNKEKNPHDIRPSITSYKVKSSPIENGVLINHGDLGFKEADVPLIS